MKEKKFDIKVIKREQTPKVDMINKTQFNTSLKEKVEAMRDWLDKNTRGIAIAFNQLSIDGERCLLRGCLTKEGKVYINPKITEYCGVPFKSYEGCLTWPKMMIDAERYSKIKVEWQDLDGKKHKGEFESVEAHVLQHEVDHLNGVEEKFVSDNKRYQVRKQHNIGRNDPCPCGSGKKFKQCCIHTLSTY